jgi:nucleoside-diphosphate-sugar epimerase
MTARHPLRHDIEGILAAAPDLWELLRDRTLFLTGGTGYYGCWFLESFSHVNAALDLRAKAVVLTRRPEAFRAKMPVLTADPAIRLVQGDVRKLEAGDIRRQLGSAAPERFDFVIHAAAETDSRLYEKQTFAMLDTIIEGTRATLEFARDAGARRFLFTSSGAVYGRQPADISHIPEEYTGGPDTSRFNGLNAYAEGKRLAETLCAGYHDVYGLETLIARPFATLGPHLSLDWHFILGHFLADALAGREIELRGDGTPHRSYLYAADQTLWLWTILLRGQPARPYNVGSSLGRPLREVAELVAGMVAPPLPVHIAGPADPSGPDADYVPDVSRIKSELGVTERVDLPAGIRRTLDWHRQAAKLPVVRR